MPDNKLLYSKDGKEIYELDDTPENREKADSKGYKQYIDVSHPDHGHYTIPADMDSLQKAQDKGYSLSGVEQLLLTNPHSTGAEALGMGLAGGYTMGASDLALNKLTTPQVVEQVKQEHPYLHATGDVIGTIASPISVGSKLFKAAGTTTAKYAPKVMKFVEESPLLRSLLLHPASSTAKATIDAGTKAAIEGKSNEQIKDTMLDTAATAGVLTGTGAVLGQTSKAVKGVVNNLTKGPELPPKPIAPVTSDIGALQRNISNTEEGLAKAKTIHADEAAGIPALENKLQVDKGLDTAQKLTAKKGAAATKAADVSRLENKLTAMQDDLGSSKEALEQYQQSLAEYMNKKNLSDSQRSELLKLASMFVPTKVKVAAKYGDKAAGGLAKAMQNPALSRALVDVYEQNKSKQKE